MCVLRVTSESNSFKTFLKETEFPVYQIHEKGEVKTVRKRRIYNDYGFSSDVSNREWDNLAGQIEDAHTFLKMHEKALRNLQSLNYVTDIRLDFPYSCRLDDQVFMQCDYLPPDFLKLAGSLGIGIELSHYHPSNEDEDSEPDS